MMYLTNGQIKAAAYFLATPRVKQLLAAGKGGRYAFVFGSSTSIARPVTITVQGEDGTVMSKDITDYDSW